jgi:hypothetical protein
VVFGILVSQLARLRIIYFAAIKKATFNIVNLRIFDFDLQMFTLMRHGSPRQLKILESEGSSF